MIEFNMGFICSSGNTNEECWNDELVKGWQMGFHLQVNSMKNTQEYFF